ncbi:MAG: FHA domain-containing protein [Caldilineaceae bacterium]
MTYVARLFGLMLLCVAFGVLPAKLYAQASQPPFLNIVNVDRTNAPTVQLAVVGSNLGGDLSTLPLKLFEGDKPKTPASDETAIAGGQTAFVIDPHNIEVAGLSGHSHHDEAAGAILGLISGNVITRNVDLLAAYSVKADGSLQTIQDWTREPNLIFNHTMQSKFEEVGDSTVLTNLLLQVLDKFQTQPSGLARSLILFSTGATAFDVTKVVAKASEQNVYIHTVGLATPNQQPSQPNALQQVAEQTHGRYVFLSASANLNTLWGFVAGLRIQRKLSYQADSATPAPLKVQLSLPSGSIAEANFKPDGWTMDAAQSAQATTNTVAAAPKAAPVAVAAVTTATDVTANNAAAAPAAPAAQNADAAAPVDNTSPSEAANHSTNVVIPGIAVAVPRLALQLALPILILLLAYFVYRELRERRAPAGQPNLRMNNRRNNHYELGDTLSNLKPLAKSRVEDADNYMLQSDDDEMPLPVGEPMPTPRYTTPTYEDDPDDEATIVPRPAFGDDEATYRRSEQIEQPIVGYFVRVTGNPTLPNELPIYGLNPTRGAARQIHIGRHSKNNTVIINDKSISREHAVIVQKEGRLYLRDNASTAGTFLNGKRLQPGEELLLRHNDLASFGEVTYEFHAKGEDEATVASE